ncbi:hypothetical protein PoB_003359700 [Plakobranchus ocellatus]|uniref:Uncharacterized protein n=1 Tax=Plakobranchus ocellatus TaxID=259542 RepID=A0AAV4AJM0_9GAST|nr:hypothetical protein PoB_003359700 [Plakobranchus ocellatus]
MNTTVQQGRESTLDTLKEKFLKGVNDYISYAKTAIREETKDRADEIFHSAVDLLSTAIPHRTYRATTPGQPVANPSRLSSAGSTRVASAPPRRPSIDTAPGNSSAQSTLTTSAISPTLPVTNRSRNNFAPSSPTTASATSSSLKKLRQNINFTVKVTRDMDKPQIPDVKLLQDNRFLMVDQSNKCIKLFNTQSEHLFTLRCRDEPHCLAVLNSTDKNPTVAATLPCLPGIYLLEVTGQNMRVKMDVKPELSASHMEDDKKQGKNYTAYEKELILKILKQGRIRRGGRRGSRAPDSLHSNYYVPVDVDYVLF